MLEMRVQAMLGLPAGTFVHVNLMEKLKGLEMMFLASVSREDTVGMSFLFLSHPKQRKVKPNLVSSVLTRFM